MEDLFKKITRATGHLPLAGNFISRLTIEQTLGERSFEKRQKTVPFAIGISALMVLCHAWQAKMGETEGSERIEKVRQYLVETGTIDTALLPEIGKVSFFYIYSLVNILVAVSQAYIGYRIVSGHIRQKKTRLRKFFNAIGFSPEDESAPNLAPLVQYIMQAAEGDAQKQDTLKAVVDQRIIDTFLMAASYHEQWDDIELEKEEVQTILQNIYKNQCPIIEIPKIEYKNGKVSVKVLIEFLITFSAQVVYFTLR